MSGVGRRLRELREASSFSQYELSELSGIPQKSLSNYEHDTEIPSSVAVRLAIVFQVSTDYLLGLIEDKQINLSTLSPAEIMAVNRWRNGDRIGAIRIIAGGE